MESEAQIVSVEFPKDVQCGSDQVQTEVHRITLTVALNVAYVLFQHNNDPNDQEVMEAS